MIVDALCAAISRVPNSQSSVRLQTMKKPAAACQTVKKPAAARRTLKKPAAKKEKVDWSRVTEDEEDKCYADFVEERDWNQSCHEPQEKFRTFRQTWFLNHVERQRTEPW